MMARVRGFGVAFLFVFGLVVVAGAVDSDLPVLRMLEWTGIGFGLMSLGVFFGGRWSNEQS